MLLTHSLPPQFLLPSWSGPELAQALQRSHFSGSARRAIRISKHISRKGSGKTGAAQLFQRERPSGTSIANAHGTNTEGRSARPSQSDISYAGIRHFKPIRTTLTAPRSVRPTPISSSTFFVGKQYNGPGRIGLTNSNNVSAASAPVRGTQVDSLAQKATAELSEPADIPSQRPYRRSRRYRTSPGVRDLAVSLNGEGGIQEASELGKITHMLSKPSAYATKNSRRMAVGSSVGKDVENLHNQRVGSTPSLIISRSAYRQKPRKASPVENVQDNETIPDQSGPADMIDTGRSQDISLGTDVGSSAESLRNKIVEPVSSLPIRKSQVLELSQEAMVGSYIWKLSRDEIDSPKPNRPAKTVSDRSSQVMSQATRARKPIETESPQKKRGISGLIPVVHQKSKVKLCNASRVEDAELEAALQKSVRSKQDPSMQGRKHALKELGVPSSYTPASKAADRKAGKPPSKPVEPMSLFDELFPEESRALSIEKREAEQRLEKLPAFNWIPEEIHGDGREQERQERKAKLYAIPKREDTSVKTQFTPLTTQTQQEARKEPGIQWRQAGVLILQACSKTLVESDFFRIGPKGNHIEGWTSGIVKVIPARDNVTLESLGHYFIVFSSDAAARSYMDNVLRIHNLWKTHGESSAFMPPPPGALRPGEDVKQLLRGFSLVPGQNRLSIRMVGRPYSTGVTRVLQQGGPAAIAEKHSNGEALVLFSVDVGYISYFDVRRAVRDDGKRRNLHWKFAGGKDINITELKSANEIEPHDESSGGSKSNDRKRSTFRAPPRYILSLKDMHEARRFVREWHCRPFDVARDHRELGQESPAIVSAEVLW